MGWGSTSSIKDLATRMALQAFFDKLDQDKAQTWAGLTLTNLTASQLVQTDDNKAMASAADLTTFIIGTENEIDVTDNVGSVIIGIVNPLIVAKGGTGAATLTDHSLLVGSGTDAITALGVATNGQIPIGSTGADPVLAAITGTANQITVANAAGSITLSTPQDIHTGASPTFVDLTLGGLLAMDAAVATAIDIDGSYTGSQITLTGTSATDHALEIDGVYSAALIYTHTSSATADTMLWGDMASTATTGDFNGLRPRLTCNAASGGLNARAVYGEVIVGASKYAALAQGSLSHISYAAGSCHITDIHALGVHISQGASLTATNLYGIIATVQTRGDENISGNDYMMRLENEAVGGNGRQMDGAIQIVNTNMSGGTKGYGYGIDFSGGTFATAEIRFSNGETIDNLVDGRLNFGSANILTTGTLGAGAITGTSFIIGGNTLNTNEWAVLDGVTANMVLDWTADQGATNIHKDNLVDSGNWDAAYTHVSNDGSDHSFIDQSVISGSSPTLDGTNLTGIPDGALDSTFLKNIVEDASPQLGADLDGQSTYDLTNIVNAEFEGVIGVGVAPSAIYAIKIARTISDATAPIGVLNNIINTRNSGTIVATTGYYSLPNWYPPSLSANISMTVIAGFYSSPTVQLPSGTAYDMTVASMYGYYSQLNLIEGAGAGVLTVTNGYGYYAEDAYTIENPVLTNLYAFYDSGQTAGVTNWGLGINTQSYINANLSVGKNTTPTVALDVNGGIKAIIADATAVPCLTLDQDDISEGCIDFLASDRGVITGATDSVESIRIEVNGVVRRIAVYADA